MSKRKVRLLLLVIIMFFWISAFKTLESPHLQPDPPLNFDSVPESAETEDAEALYDLGILHAFGEGVQQDDLKAADLFRKAAELGFAPAQAKLGDMYRDGVGVPKNYFFADKWYGNAIINGYRAARGWFDVVNREVCMFKLYREDAEAGEAEAQFVLGQYYEWDDGIPKNLTAAKEWYGKASDQGHAIAKARLYFLNQNDSAASKDSSVVAEGSSIAKPSEAQPCQQRIREVGEAVISAEKFGNTVVCLIANREQGEVNLLVMNGDKVISETEVGIAESKQLPFDLLGNGAKYLAVETRSWKDGCCYKLLVFDLDDSAKPIDLGPAATYETSGNAPNFVNLDDDPALEIEIVDDSYAYRKTAWSQPPVPKVILDFKDGKYRVSTELMKRPPVESSSLKKKSARADDADLQQDYRGLHSNVRETMLDLIYSGNADQAYKFLAMVPRTEAEKVASFTCDLAQHLTSSSFWGNIRSMNPYFQNGQHRVQGSVECPAT